MKLPVVVGTTGWLAQLEQARAAIDKNGSALVWSPNFSVGVNVFLRVVREAAKLLADEKELDPADYDMLGVLGQVSSTVHAGGTGEMIFSQAGTRRAASIRAENGEAIPKGVEVVVTRFEKGIAYVRRWEELSEATGPSASDHKEN